MPASDIVTSQSPGLRAGGSSARAALTISSGARATAVDHARRALPGRLLALPNGAVESWSEDK
jgi:hypothetical protein